MVPQGSQSDRSSSLVLVLRLLRERWWILLLSVVLATLVTIGLDQRKTPQYRATATLLFGEASTNVGGVLNANASNVSNDPQRDQGTTLLLVTSSAVAERVRRALVSEDSPETLAAAITATAESDANLIDVTATDPDPRRAAMLANAFAEQYRRFRQESDRAGLAQGVADLQRQLAETPPEATSQLVSLRDALSQLNILRATSTGGAQVVDRATAPTVAALPQTKRDAVLGALLGLAFGFVVIFALDLFDRRLKSVPALESAYNLTALASVSLDRSTPRDEGERLAKLEPYRILRSGLQLMDPGGQVKVVIVTSAVPGEGKTTTAIGLAQATAYSGARVALVETDLRRPTFHDRFDLEGNQRGLATALLGEASIDDVLHKTVADYPTLEIVAAGGLARRSAELLGSRYMTTVIERLRESFDLIVLDAPPLLPVADTRVLLDAQGVDACLVVGKVFNTTRDEAARARAILDHHRVRHLGLVANGLRGSAMRYEYEGSYYGTDDGGPPGQEELLVASQRAVDAAKR